MSRRYDDDLRAKLLLACLRSDSVESALDRLSRDEATVAKDLTKPGLRNLIVEIGDCEIQFLGERLVTLRDKHDFHWRELAAFAYLLCLGDGRTHADYARVESVVSGLLLPDSPFWVLLRACQARASLNAGRPDEADYHVRDAESRLAQQRHSMLRLLCLPRVRCESGLLHMNRGNFAAARIDFQEAADLCTNYALRSAPLAAGHLASLLWASGQFKRALEIHRSAEHRAAGAKLGPSWLVPSHLSAAKCAIDLEDADVARTELRAADQLLRESSNLPQRLRGYYILYSGELLVLDGKLEAAVAKFDEACGVFESIDPPFHTGLLDAKIAMANHAISKRDHARLFPIIHKLLEEAEEKGCLEARARLLVLESALFVSENRPLRAAFDDLVTRMHLIQNPALMLQALANLYLHSLRYLDQPDQAFLMARLRRLQKVLEEWDPLESTCRHASLSIL